MSRVFSTTYTPPEKVDCGMAGDHFVTFHATITNHYGPGTFEQKVFIYKAVLSISYPDRDVVLVDITPQVLSSPVERREWKTEILDDWQSKAGGNEDDIFDSAREADILARQEKEGA